MFRLLIVDDEKNERDCLKYLLKNSSLSLDIKEADSGIEALKILKTWQADILLTDVQMPVMNGLELMENVFKLYPHIRLIIFSNYAEFEYAKVALTYGVENYILKPVVPTELENTLSSIIQQIEEEASVNKQIQQSMLQSAIQFSIYGNLNKKDFNKDIINELSKFKRMMLLEFPANFLESNYTDLIEKIKTNLNMDIISLNMSPQLLLLFKNNINDEFIFCQKIFNIILNEYDIKTYITISKKRNSNDLLEDTFSLLEQQMEHRFWSNNNFIFLPNSNHSKEYDISFDSDTDDDTIMNMIKKSLSSKDEDSFKNSLNIFLNKYKKQSNQSEIYIKFIFSNLVASLYPFLPEEYKNKTNSVSDIIANLYLQKDLNKIIEIVSELSQLIISTFKEKNQSIRKEILIVQNYIHNHYDKELSIEVLASTVFLSPDYLSRIFKKSTGKSLYQYIRQYRMEQASRLLLNTTKKVIAIGIETGYPNYSYFCQSFNEYFGKSPEKYRQENKND